MMSPTATKLMVIVVLIATSTLYLAESFSPSSSLLSLKSIHIQNNIVNFQHRSPNSKLQPLQMASTPPSNETTDSKLPMLLDPGTKGGALFLSLVLFIIPIIGYEVATLGMGMDGIEVGKWVGVGFTLFTTVLWVATYIFRVATKDMTYAKQLKDYENAVIAKRLEELDEDEIQALVEDIERDDF